MKKPKLKTIDIEIALACYFGIRKNVIVCNVSDWSGVTLFETDMISLSNSGYATGVEIKISKQDLKKDLKKKQWKTLNKLLWNGKTGYETYFGIFKYFYYAVPWFLVEDVKLQIPDWCGIYSINEKGIVRLERKSKVLFKNKWKFEKRYKLARLGCMRSLNTKQALQNSRNKYLESKKLEV